jgi:hypothetical protein
LLPSFEAQGQMRSRSGISSRNTLTALGPTTLEHQSARLGGHPLAEAVAMSSLEIAGLKCPLHGSLLQRFRKFSRQRLMKCRVKVKKNTPVIHTIPIPFLSKKQDRKNPGFPGAVNRQVPGNI